VYYHAIGTDQSKDTLIYSDPENPELFYGGAYVTFDGEWLWMRITKSSDPVNKFWIAKLDNGALPSDCFPLLITFLIVGKLKWLKIKDDFDFGLNYTANFENVFYFESNHNAPHGKIVRYDIDRPVPFHSNLN
jgi:prolyl oligopeptidase